MFRLWAKIFKNNKLLKDMTVDNDDAQLNRTKKVFLAINVDKSKKTEYTFNIYIGIII